MSFCPFFKKALAATLAYSVAAAVLSAGLIVENFTDYGPSQSNIVGLNGGSGWSTGWDEGEPPADAFYIPDVNLSYSAEGYLNIDNTSGVAGYVSNESGSTLPSRLFDALTGTIWVSFLAQIDEASDRSLLWLDDDGSEGNSGDLVGILNGEVSLRYGDVNSNTTLTAGLAPLNTTHLFLAKIEIDASGSDDTFSMWLNPDLSGGEEGLGNATLSAPAGDHFGTGLDGTPFSCATSARIPEVSLSTPSA